MKKQLIVFLNLLSIPTKAQLASFKVAHRIAKCKKTHIFAEELLLPGTIDLDSTMVGEVAEQELKVVPLSKQHYLERIEIIADDINDQLVAKMLENEFSLQLDEATTSTRNKDAYLICYLRFIENNSNIVEGLLFCKPSLTSCKAT